MVKTVLSTLQNKDSTPMVTYGLGDAVRNKTLIYNETVNSIFLDEEVP